MLVARSKPVYIGWLEATVLLSTYLRRRGYLYMYVLRKSYHGLVRGRGQGKSKPLPQLRLPERRLKESSLHQRQVPSDLEQACHWRARLLIMYRERELLHGGKLGPRRPDLKKQGIQMFEDRRTVGKPNCEANFSLLLSSSVADQVLCSCNRRV